MTQEKRGKGPGDQGGQSGMNPRESGMSGKGGQMNYSENEVRTVLTRGDMKSWNDVINWLDKNGQREAGLSSTHVQALRQDIQKLQDQGAEFTKDPNRVIQMIQRQHNQ